MHSQIEPNLPVRCCELRGVPRKCIYACDLKTDKEISQREANYYDQCTNYMDVIDNCRKGENVKLLSLRLTINVNNVLCAI